MRRMIIFAATVALSACAPKVITQDRPVTVKVPVAVGCALPRPAAPVPLSQRSDWDALDVRQKAALVGKQAVELRTYGEQLSAATAGCE